MTDECARRAQGDTTRAADVMRAAASVDQPGSDGQAGLMAWLRQLKQECPEGFDRLVADVAIKRAARALPGTLNTAQ